VPAEHGVGEHVLAQDLVVVEHPPSRRQLPEDVTGQAAVHGAPPRHQAADDDADDADGRCQPGTPAPGGRRATSLGGLGRRDGTCFVDRPVS
jgi:hypothetical protein